MAHNAADLPRFLQLRAQAAQKKQLEANQAALTAQCQALSDRAAACKKVRLEAEQELADLESGGAKGFLYTIAGGKAQRLKSAQDALRTAKADDQQAAWELAQAQASLFQMERTLEGLAGVDEALVEARQARGTALKAAGLPQSQQLRSLEESLSQGADLVQAITGLCAQCQTAVEAAQRTLDLAERSEFSRNFSTIGMLETLSDKTLQAQQVLAAGLASLLAQAEGTLLHLEEVQDDLLAQPFFPSPGEDQDML